MIKKYNSIYNYVDINTLIFVSTQLNTTSDNKNKLEEKVDGTVDAKSDFVDTPSNNNLFLFQRYDIARNIHCGVNTFF